MAVSHCHDTLPPFYPPSPTFAFNSRELQKLKDLNGWIHKEVDRILLDFKRNREDYQQTRAKVTQPKVKTEIKTVQPLTSEETAQQMRLDEAIALAWSKKLEVDDQFTEILRY